MLLGEAPHFGMNGMTVSCLVYVSEHLLLKIKQNSSRVKILKIQL